MQLSNCTPFASKPAQPKFRYTNCCSHAVMQYSKYIPQCLKLKWLITGFQPVSLEKTQAIVKIELARSPETAVM
eukprot:4688170-Amphidinium_carterae.1